MLFLTYIFQDEKGREDQHTASQKSERLIMRDRKISNNFHHHLL
jgi:hypothetical protein